MKVNTSFELAKKGYALQTTPVIQIGGSGDGMALGIGLWHNNRPSGGEWFLQTNKQQKQKTREKGYKENNQAKM